MESLSDQQLKRRIHTFLKRKHQEYPGLSLVEEPEKRARPLSHILIEAIFERITHRTPRERITLLPFDER